MNDKWKSLIELVVNEEEDKAKELFHEIAVDESRKIYENLIDEEDLADIDEASKDEAVEEATDEKVEEAEKTEESKSEEAVEEATDEVEETLAGDQTADMIDDIKADEVGITAEDDDEGEEPEADADAMSDEMGVDGEEGKMDEMLKKSNGKRTIPQIFFDDYHVGGYEELRTLEKEKKLNNLIK